MENKKVNSVFNIFVDFFGEENVDLQRLNIIIHFPKVTVTNENDRSIDITHLWVKVHLNNDGTIAGTFEMIRSEFTLDQFRAGYSHSHIPCITSSEYSNWKSPCLGTGPIRATIASLAREYSEDMWKLFCYELSKYVTVESLSGGPYIKLESIGEFDNSNNCICVFPLAFPRISISDNDNAFYECFSDYQSFINEFITYILIKKPFRFNYVNGSYGIAASDKDAYIILSNLFIEWYNSLPEDKKEGFHVNELYEKHIIVKGKFEDNKLYSCSLRNHDLEQYKHIIGTDLFSFKGTTIKLNIINPPLQEEPNQSVFIFPALFEKIINKILRTINTKYGKSTDNTSDSSKERYFYI